MPYFVCVCVHIVICKCTKECVFCVQGQLEVCCWTTVLDLLTNHLNSVQAGASLSV